MRYQPILITCVFFGVLATIVLAAIRYGANWPPGGIAGFLVAVIVCVLPFALLATILEYRRAKRQAAIEALAGKLRFKFAADGSPEVAERLGRRLGGQFRNLPIDHGRHKFELHNVIEGDRSGIQILVGELQHTIEAEEGSDEVTKRTFFYFTGPALNLPRFYVEPGERRRRLHVRLVQQLAGRTGLQDPDIPLPSAGDYHLSSSEAEATKRLFGVKLQNHLATHKGWEICTEQNSILFARMGSEPVAKWEELLTESMQILALLNQST